MHHSSGTAHDVQITISLFRYLQSSQIVPYPGPEWRHYDMMDMKDNVVTTTSSSSSGSAAIAGRLGGAGDGDE